MRRQHDIMYWRGKVTLTTKNKRSKHSKSPQNFRGRLRPQFWLFWKISSIKWKNIVPHFTFSYWIQTDLENQAPYSTVDRVSKKLNILECKMTFSVHFWGKFKNFLLKKNFHVISKWRRYVTRHLCSKIKDFLPCLPGEGRGFSISFIHKY